MEDQHKIILFGPRSGKSLQRLYPELSKESEFKDLPADEMYFAWLMGNPSSPVDESWTDQVRHVNAASVAFVNNPDKKKTYGAGNIPDNVKIAIAKMRTYAPEARMKAKQMVQAIFHNYEKMVNVDPTTDFVDEDGKINWAGRKQYIDSAKTIAESLPNLIKQLEEGFGIELKKNESIGTKSIDKFHKQKNNE